MILNFAESQRNYHRTALQLLEQHIPELENKWKEHLQKPVFGCNIDEHLRVSRRSIALPIEICVCTLYETGMDEEGLFRIAGGATKVRKFRVRKPSIQSFFLILTDLIRIVSLILLKKLPLIYLRNN